MTRLLPPPTSLLLLSLVILPLFSFPLPPLSPHLRAKAAPGKAPDFRCDDSKLLSVVCGVFNRILLSKIADAGLSISSSGVLFSYANVTPRAVPHTSCHSGAIINNVTLSAQATSEVPLNVSLTGIDAAAVIPARVPVFIRADADMTHTFGIGIWDCHVYARDDFGLHGRLETVADSLVGVTLQPRLKKLENGDLEFSVTPQVVLEFELEDTEIAFHASDVGFLTGIWAAVVGFVGSPGVLFDGVVDVFSGGNVLGVLQDVVKGLAYHLGAPVMLGVGALPDDVEEKVLDLFGDPFERKAEKIAKGFADDIEDGLNEKLRHALGLGEDGVKKWVVNKHIVTLVNLFGFGALDKFIKEGHIMEMRNDWERAEEWASVYGSAWE